MSRVYIYVFIEKGLNCFSLHWKSELSLDRAWGVKVVFGEENQDCPVKCPIVLVSWNSKFRSCLDNKRMEVCVNSAILRHSSFLDMNPTEKCVFEIENGCKAASVNSREHCTPAQPTWTRPGETKPNLKICFIKLTNCHHYKVLWWPSRNLKIQFRPPWELFRHVTIIWEMNCDCSGFLRTEDF